MNTNIERWRNRLESGVYIKEISPARKNVYRGMQAVCEAADAEIAELRAALEAAQSATQQGDGELTPLPSKAYLGGDEAFGDVVTGYTDESMWDYARAAIAQRAGSGEAKPIAHVTGYYAGHCVIKAAMPGQILPINMALFTVPPAQPD